MEEASYLATILRDCVGVQRRDLLLAQMRFSTPAASCLFKAPTRLQKNSSKFLEEMARKRRRCRAGTSRRCENSQSELERQALSQISYPINRCLAGLLPPSSLYCLKLNNVLWTGE